MGASIAVAGMIACLALGSRGDAEPLLAVIEDSLASHRASRGAMQAVFACRPSVWHTIVQANPCVQNEIRFSPIRDCSIQMAIALQARRKGIRFADIKDLAVSEAEADAFVVGEREDMVHACAGASVVICNLFSLEGVHIAEKLAARCVVLSPCLLPAGGCPT
eukprot:3452677-Rhodomonas_salina.1